MPDATLYSYKSKIVSDTVKTSACPESPQRHGGGSDTLRTPVKDVNYSHSSESSPIPLESQVQFVEMVHIGVVLISIESHPHRIRSSHLRRSKASPSHRLLPSPRRPGCLAATRTSGCVRCRAACGRWWPRRPGCERTWPRSSVHPR
jgi:hypothetical protein